MVSYLINYNHISPSSSISKRWQVELVETCMVGQVPQGLDHSGCSPLYSLNCLLIQNIVGTPNRVAIF